MKFFYLCLIVIPFFISCGDSTTVEDVTPVFTHRDSIITAANMANPYDIAGQLHNDLYAAYYASDSLEAGVSAISSRVDLLARENVLFMSIAGTNFPFLSVGRIDYILTNTSISQSEIIDSSLVATASKVSLTTFIDSLLLLCETEDDYSVLYDFVVCYEDGVLSNTTLTAWDKKVILITTSIARHSVYERKKKPKKNTDPEWDLMVGNIVACVEGATDSLEKAVLMSLITGIAENAE